jgi:peptidoglycan/xylan/chitin deacetylase (PgdA/CDA1 family)
MRDDPGGGKRTSLRFPLSVFHICAGAAILTSAGILIFDSRLALLPIALLFLACLIAPFVPRLGFFLPVLTRGSRIQPVAALTFDDGPDPVTTPMLLDLLSRHRAPATFFVIGAKAERHPDLVRAILAGGHEIGNHTYAHDVFLMLRGRARLRREIARAQDVLRPFGIRPLVFRPPVGITNPWLLGALVDAGMICVCFRRRPADFGNRRIKRLKERVARNLAAGDILLMHEGIARPSEGQARALLAAVEGVLEKMAQRGLRPALLSETIRRPVFEPVPSPSGNPEEPPRGGVPAGALKPGKGNR